MAVHPEGIPDARPFVVGAWADLAGGSRVPSSCDQVKMLPGDWLL